MICKPLKRKNKMRKQSLFREKMDLSNVSKILTKDVELLEEIYTTYLDIEKYLNIDVLTVAQDKLEDAIKLLSQSNRLASLKTRLAFIETFMKMKTHYDIYSNLGSLKNIVNDCITARNFYYNSTNPKEKEASKKLQQVITLLMDFSEDLKEVKKSIPLI